MQPRSKPPLDERLVLGVLLLSFSSACAAPSTKEPPPPFIISAENFTGTVLTGPLVGEAQLEAEPWLVDLLLARVDQFPEGEGEALASRVRHVFVELDGEPLKTRGELALGVRVSEGAAPLPEPVWRERQIEALWPGTTVRWVTTPNAEHEDPARTSWEAFGVEVSRVADAPGRLELALSFDGWVTPAPSDDSDEEAGEVADDALVSTPAPAPVHRRERILLDATEVAAGEAMRLLLPSPRLGLPQAATIVELRVATSPDLASPELQTAVERSRAAFLATAESAGTGESFGPDSGFRLERARAVEALEDASLRRPALVFLANAAGAVPTSELALMADEESLGSFLTELMKQLAELEVELDDPQACGWFLERTTYDWLARLAVDPESQLPPELESLLIRHAGELGRFPDLVLETVSASSDQAELRKRFDAENRIFLEDSQPAARVRAFDWLSTRGVAPADYDPLGSLPERREALARSAEETP